MQTENAISLREAADRLGVSYQTVWQRRHKIAFRLPDCRKWLVWPSTLEQLSQPSYNVTRLALRHDTKESLCRSSSVMAYGGSISARQAAKELDALLGQPTKGRPRNTTIV